MNVRNIRPAVIIDPAEPESAATESVIQHIGQLGWDDETLQSRLIRVYVRGGELVQVLPSIEIEDEGRLLIRPLPKPLVRERVTQACALKKIRLNSEGDEVKVLTSPPRLACRRNPSSLAFWRIDSAAHWNHRSPHDSPRWIDSANARL